MYIMADCVAYNFAENKIWVYLKPFACGSPSNRARIPYICSAMLDIANIHLTLKMSIKVRNWECQNNKVYAGRRTEKRAKTRLNRTSGVSCSPDEGNKNITEQRRSQYRAAAAGLWSVSAMPFTPFVSHIVLCIMLLKMKRPQVKYINKNKMEINFILKLRMIVRCQVEEQNF